METYTTGDNPGKSGSLEEAPILTKCFFNWITNDAPLEPKDAEGIAARISNKSESVTANVIPQLRVFPVATISMQLCLAFSHLILNKPEEAGKNLKDAANFIKEASENELISKDYVQGLTYLISGVETSRISLLMESAGDDKDERTKDERSKKDLKIPSGECPLDRQSLSLLAREVIMGVHAVFLGCRRQTAEEIKVLQCLNSNSENIEWPLRLHIALRTYRKDKICRGTPCREEKDVINRAIKLNREHIYTKLQVCMYLSDVIGALDYATNGSSEGLLLEGYLEFNSIQDVAHYIKKICREILETEEGISLPMVNLTIADIVGFALPIKYREIKWAEECLSRALLQNPKSSKANHRMGIHLLANSGDPEKALEYLKIAFDNNPTNVSALIDRIKMLLRYPGENASELDVMFEECVIQNRKQWPLFRLMSLLFTKGIYHFMKLEKEVALWTWIEAYKIDPLCLIQFTQIPNICRRYQWEPTRFCTTEVLEYLKNVMNGKEGILLPTADSKIVSILISSLNKAYVKTSLNIGIASGDGRIRPQQHVPHVERGYIRYISVQPCISDGIDNWRSGNLERTGNQDVPRSRKLTSYRNPKQNVNVIREPMTPGPDGGRGSKSPDDRNWRET